MTNALMEAAERHGAAHVLMDGLTSQGSYIRVAGSNGMHLAISPAVYAIADGVVMVGGKIRSAWDQTYGGEAPQVEPVDEAQAVKMLRDAYEGIEWANMGPHRLSTSVGYAIAISPYDPESYATKGKSPEDVVTGLFAMITETGAEIENEEVVRKILEEAIQDGLNRYFKVKETPDLLVSELVNTADGNYTNVVSFADKLAEKQQEEEVVEEDPVV